MQTNIGKNILATIVYYDGMDYPMTSFEIWKYMLRNNYFLSDTCLVKTSLFDVQQALKSESLREYIEEENGFYFLRGRSELISQRVKKNKIASLKLMRLRRIVRLIRFVPFVRMVGVTGRLAMKNINSKSDWDLFLVMRKGKIWTGRTLVTLLVHFLKKRRHGKKVTDRVCLNYFVTDESLEISTKDLFSANEYTFILPMFGEACFKSFQLRNLWMREMKPHYELTEVMPLPMISDNFFSHNIRRFGEFVMGMEFIEKTLAFLEKKRIMKNPKTYLEGGLVHASNDALVFLPKPRGPLFFEMFKKKIERFFD